MTFLPIVERELRVAARRRGTYWSRFVAGIIGTILAGWVLAMTSDQPAPWAGAALFGTLSALIFIYAAAAGIGVTYDTLSGEKRDGTLGLLFLTDLKGYDVVLGKLGATTLNAFYGMLAVVPVLAIPFLMGAVARAEFWRIVLVAVNLLYFVMGVGIFSSAVCRSDARALGLASVVVVIILCATPLYAVWQDSHHSSYDPRAVLLVSPGFGCVTAFDGLYRLLGGVSFWLNALITHLYGWIFLLLACWVAPRSWQDAVVNENARPLRRKWRTLMHGSAARFLAVRRRLLGINPFLWRAAPEPSAARPVWLGMGAAALIWLGLCRLFDTKPSEPEFIAGLFIILTVLLKIWVARAASGKLAGDRRSGALELVLTTPLTGEDIVHGQRLALWRQFGAPTMTLFATILLYVIKECRSSVAFEHDPSLFWSYMTLAAFLLGDLYALSWTAMWFGLKFRKSGRPAIAALAVILAPPVIVLALATAFAALCLPRFNFGPGFAYGVLAVMGLIIDVWFGAQCERNLRTRFHTTVADTLAPIRAAK